MVITTNATIARSRTGIPAALVLATLRHALAQQPVLEPRAARKQVCIEGTTAPFAGLVAAAVIDGTATAGNAANGNATTRLAPLEEVPV